MLHKTHLPYWNALPQLLLVHSYRTPHLEHWWEHELWTWICKSHTTL